MRHAPSAVPVMRIVADTNTALSGLLWQGPPRRLLDLARNRTITLYTSQTLLAELAEVIVRDKFADRIFAAGVSASALVQGYEDLVEIVDPQPLPVPVSRDPDDDHVLACAVAAGAYLVVSRDKDLLDLHEYRGIPILASADALQRIEARK
jgi:uncharacterized protein